MSFYNVNLQREILREKSAEILADIHRYMEANAVEKFAENTPIGIIHAVVGNIYRNAFKSEFNEVAKIDAAHGKLDLARHILNTCYLD